MSEETVSGVDPIELHEAQRVAAALADAGYRASVSQDGQVLLPGHEAARLTYEALRDDVHTDDDCPAVEQAERQGIRDFQRGHDHGYREGVKVGRLAERKSGEATPAASDGSCGPVGGVDLTEAIEAAIPAVLETMGWPDDRLEPPSGELCIGSYWELAGDVAGAAVTAAARVFTARHAAEVAKLRAELDEALEETRGWRDHINEGVTAVLTVDVRRAAVAAAARVQAYVDNCTCLEFQATPEQNRQPCWSGHCLDVGGYVDAAIQVLQVRRPFEQLAAERRGWASGLLHAAAECHRKNWGYDQHDPTENRPTPTFNALHALGCQFHAESNAARAATPTTGTQEDPDA